MGSSGARRLQTTDDATTAGDASQDPLVVGDVPPDDGAITGGQSEEMEDGELDVTTAAVGGLSPPASSGSETQESEAPSAAEAEEGASSYLLVLSPLADEITFNGGVAQIRWISSVALTHVDIYLSDGTAIGRKLPVGDAAPHKVMSHYWAVRAAPNPRYTLEVMGYPDGGGPVLVNSSAPFTVQDQTTLTVTEPAANADIVHGESTWIRWATTGAAATNVVISIAFAARDNDAFFFGSVPNSGEFLWVPSAALAPGPYRVKIEYSPSSQANVTTIGEPFNLREPAQESVLAFATPAAGGEKLLAGRTFVYVCAMCGCGWTDGGVVRAFAYAS